MADAKRDLRLVGTTTSNGGTFGKIGVTGEATINGDLACARLGIMGTVAVKGSLNADAVKLTGEFKVTGNARAGKLGGTGDAGFAGNARLETVKFSGQLQVGGNCESESLDVRGAISVDQLLNAETVTVRMFGPSRASEVGGGSVTIRKSRAATLKEAFGSGQAALFRADVIEGDAISLEHTNAKIVRGNKVTIGPGCEIGTVEFRDSLVVHKNSSVGQRIKL